ncbi:MAG: bifunctional (p)ppGpp synthetase/guanosine-3',5'-bis(diphosphate) 3'-pyrophosphohydrolase [Candidatus Micrarchaeota archaeon]|nr:bifunctional (p)ppGpp synthetase/guanosine-3',5'-bis(diphosphate) 3'-pyrophosphohydrolase [Candidatus Micrarchaeota archaeon]
MEARTARPQFKDAALQESRFRDSVHLSVKIDKLLVFKALDFAKTEHCGQVRDDGTEYIVHPIRVGRILLEEFKVTDPSVLAAAMLHDVVEDCSVQKKEVSERFGARIASIVGSLSMNLYGSKGEYYRSLRLDPADVRIITVADRTDNLRNLPYNTQDQGWTKERVDRYLKETEECVLPLTVGLGDEVRIKLSALVTETRDRKWP